MRPKWSTIFLMLFVITALVINLLNLALDAMRYYGKRACRNAGYSGRVLIDGESYCWQATEGAPVLVAELDCD